MFAAVVWAMRAAAGNLGPKLGIGGVVFLMSRKGVMIPWFVFTVAIFAFFLFGPRNPNVARPSAPIWLVLSAFLGLGATALTVGPAFMIWRLKADVPAFTLQDSERVLLQSRGNHFLDGEGRGGTVTLTNQRLAFNAHRFNVNLSAWSVALADVQHVDAAGLFAMVIQSNAGRDVLSVVARDQMLSVLRDVLAR